MCGLMLYDRNIYMYRVRFSDFPFFFFFLMRQKSGSNVKSAVGFNLCAIINILVSNVLDREMETEIKHVKKQSAGYFGMLDRSF